MCRAVQERISANEQTRTTPAMASGVPSSGAAIALILRCWTPLEGRQDRRWRGVRADREASKLMLLLAHKHADLGDTL